MYIEIDSVICWYETRVPLTVQELLARDTANTASEKWKQAESARLVLTVITASGHKFNANKEGLDNIMHKEMALLDTATCTWYEDWGSFTTNKVELQEALRLATSAYQTILDTTVGV